MSDEKTILSAYVPVELAEDATRLAAAGNRSISREIAQALREHLTVSHGASSAPSLTDTGGAMGGVASPTAQAGELL